LLVPLTFLHFYLLYLKIASVKKVFVYLFDIHAGLIMRPFYLSSNHFKFNLKYIYNVFGEQVSATVKRWIDTNYKLIRATSQVNFLKTCKVNDIVPPHLSHIYKIKFHFNHYKTSKKFERLLYNLKKKILQLEIFDLHRLIDWLTKDLSFLSFNLSNILLIYIWRVIQNFHLKSFNNFHHRLSQEHKTSILGYYRKRI